jgi:valyl-tRNA synthetase
MASDTAPAGPAPDAATAKKNGESSTRNLQAPTVLTELWLPEQKEKAKADKAAKFAAKQAKLKQQQPQPKAAAQPTPKAQAPSLPPYVDETPVGEKKKIQSFDHPHFQAYNPKAVESAWYQWWEKSGFFQPQPPRSPDAGKFVIPLPPPNVTGALHCGHALANSLQDTLIRWYRMR